MDSIKMDAVAVQADVKQSLLALHTMLAEYQTTSDYQEQIERYQREWHKEVFRCYEPKEREGRLSQMAALGVINQQVTAEDTIICAAGSLPGDLHRLWMTKAVKDYHLEYGFSCMGYEVAAGLGVRMAKVAQNIEGDAYVLVGDGSFLMMHSELLTAIEQQQKIIVVLFDNSGFQCIRNLQCAHGSKSFATERRTSIDFRTYAGSLGAKALRVDSIAGLQQALLDAKHSLQSVLIDLKVDKNSMSDGYEAWWRVAAEDAPTPDNIRAY